MRSAVAIAVLAAAILATVLGGAPAALAQEVPVARSYTDPPAAVAPVQAASPALSSAPSSTSAPIAQPTGDATADQIADWLKASAAPPDPNAPQAGDGLPRQIHGEVGVTVSNRGYSGYAAASMPLGEASEVDVAVGGAHERLPWGGTANTRSLAIGIHLDGADVGHWLKGDKCIQHAVRLRDDPVLMADGTCAKPSADAPPPDRGE